MIRALRMTATLTGILILSVMAISQETVTESHLTTPSFRQRDRLDEKDMEYIVYPMLQTYWGQSCNYNDSCPEDPAGGCGHARTGCGATAMSQIMKFHNYPVTGKGSASYTHPVYGLIQADFGNTSYDWPSMPPNLNAYSQPAQVAAVAQLMFHAGVSVEMDYGPAASSSGTTSIRNSFTDFFGYSPRAQLLRKSHFSDSVWITLLRNEIDAGRPVFYAISGGTGGHYIVLDGYSEDSSFHCNWGNGVQAGYNRLLSELPVVQEAIIGIEPDTVAPDTITTYIARFCRFDGRAGNSKKGKSLLHHYLVSPPAADSIAFFFSGLQLDPASDTLLFFDGPDTNSPLLGAFTGSDLPESLVSSSPQVCIVFSSAGDGTPLWEIEYSAFVTNVVSGLQKLTSPSGSFGDGSGASNYQNHTDAWWLIQPPGATSVTASFTGFNTEFSCDYVWVYDGENPAPKNLIGKFSGNQLPPPLTAYSGSMLIRFNSDFSTVKPGWELNYTSGYGEVFVELSVLLEGPFYGEEMNNLLQNQDYLPLQQPYNSPPWLYNGTESVAGFGGMQITDWILLELRDAASASLATSATMIARKAALLRYDGALTETSGIPILSFPGLLFQDSLFVVIRHRNHLGLLSAKGMLKQNGVYRYDFSVSEEQAFGGQQAMKELAPGQWGMAGGDGNADGQVNNSDKIDIWMPSAGFSGYLQGDFDLNGETDNSDKIGLWIPNTGMSVQVP